MPGSFVGYRPASILGELRQIAEAMTVGQFATATVGIIDADASRLVYASAGHPPVLMRRAESGEVRTLPNAGGPALGPFNDATYTQIDVPLEHGDILLMYTDGLIERRGEDLQDGIERVARELQTWHQCALLGEMCDKLVATLAGSPQLDDIAGLRRRLAAHRPASSARGPPRRRRPPGSRARAGHILGTTAPPRPAQRYSDGPQARTAPHLDRRAWP